MRVVVKDIAALFPTSIITGRSREKVCDADHIVGLAGSKKKLQA
jgi:hypothetical protein